MKSINYAWPVSAIDRDDLSAFEKWLKDSKNLIENKVIYIWGAGIRGTEFGIFLKRNGISEFEYVDNNPEKQQGNIDGVRIVSGADAIKKTKSGKAVILISTELDSDIVKQLLDEKLSKGRDFFSAPNLEYEHYVEEFKRPGDVSYIVMGDCLFSSISLKDKNTENLAEMIRSTIGDDRCKVLYMHGMGIRSYYNIFRIYGLNYGFPKRLEIMINFETLTGRQHVMPRSQHNDLFHMLDSVISIKDDEWKEYLKVVDERAGNNQVEISHRSNRLTPQQEHDMKNRNYLRLNYMYKLDPETEGLVYFRKLVKLAEDNDIEIIPFIPPVNYELGFKYFNEKFDGFYNNNLRIVKDICTELNVLPEDYSHIFSADYFAEIDTPDESVNEKGRIILRDKLVGRVNYYER